jgi:hypothetical protein
MLPARHATFSKNLWKAIWCSFTNRRPPPAMFVMDQSFSRKKTAKMQTAEKIA